jgi:hypothetical protein
MGVCKSIVAKVTSIVSWNKKLKVLLNYTFFNYKSKHGVLYLPL